jgi:hypothetical protein
MSETDDLMGLDLEYRLTIAYRSNCACAPYFARRRTVLIPEVLKAARKRDVDPIDVFAGYARGVHERHHLIEMAS